MFKNQLVVALRHLRRKKLSTFINVFGLSLGLACCVLMVAFAKHEWAVDEFHKNKKNLFRIVTQRFLPNGEMEKYRFINAMFFIQYVETLKDELPGVVHASAFLRNENVLIARGDQIFQQTVGLVSNDFLSMFTFPLLAGNPTTALAQPAGVVISETVAHKFFDPKNDYGNLLGQSLKMKKKDFVVRGVMVDVPNTSSLQFDVLISTEDSRGFKRSLNYNRVMAPVYVQSIERPAKQLVEDLNRWDGKEKVRNIMAPKLRADAFRFTLQPLTDVYGNTDIPNPYESQSDLAIVYMLWGFAGLVLVIACINFTTLSVAQSSGRAIEVGLRKVYGANQGQIVRQFWGESLALSFFGLLLGIALAELFLPVFNGFIQRDLTLSYDDGLSLLLLFAMTGLFAGSYPALVLSRVQPVAVLKKELRIGGHNRLTRLLVVVQSVASITLLICAGIMVLQQTYMYERDLGYARQRIAVIPISVPFRGNVEEYKLRKSQIIKRYKRAILKDPHIAGVAMTDRPFYSLSPPGKAYPLPDGSKISLPIIGVDAAYLPTLNIPLLEGRNFSEAHPTDKKEAVVINETLAKRLHLKDPVGKVLPKFELWEMKDPVIIGVVRDFHFESLHKKIKPMVLQTYRFDNGPFLLVRMHSGNPSEMITMLKETWQVVAPNIPLEVLLLDERRKQVYLGEVYWYRVLIYSAILTLVISLLGLFGLASLAVVQRTKEIGVRKVLGASERYLVWLLSKDFAKLLLLANAIAWPMAYWIMDEWLTTTFAYHMDLGIGVFILVGALTYSIAQLTILGHILKVIRQNPIRALRYE